MKTAIKIIVAVLLAISLAIFFIALEGAFKLEIIV